jgi:wyosine [tRNA(Phe)-imidazoG37] synthetase (radical SAM superfamily)
LFKNTIEEIWQGKEAQLVRASIIDQSYKYCSLDICPAWISKTIPEDELINELHPGWNDGVATTQFRLPEEVKFNFDNSCNLWCPSCRTDRVQYNPEHHKYSQAEHILNQIKLAYLSKPSTAKFGFTITSSGDAIGSHLYRNFLLSLDGEQFPNMRLIILTNGVMLTEKVINQMARIHKNIKQITISVDAATADTYNIVRAGGDFEQLQKNIEYLNQCRTLAHVNLAYTFVVQRDNFKEMKQFADWMLKYPRSKIRFTRIVQFNNQAKSHFRDQNLWSPAHKDHNEFFDAMADTWVNNPRIQWTNIQQKPSFQTLQFRRNIDHI